MFYDEISSQEEIKSISKGRLEQGFTSLYFQIVGISLL